MSLDRHQRAALFGNKPRDNPEEQLQRAIWAHVQMRGTPDAIIYHCPNGGARSKATAGRLKAMGVVPGIPDFCIIMPNGCPAYMELKAPKGKLSPEQKAFQAKCMRMGVDYYVIADIDSALAILEQCEVIFPEAKF